jgi:GH24 family phage-related lysozyme (muramidase)
MTDVTSDRADQLVAAYLRMRDAKEAIQREADEKIAAIQADMDQVRDALLQLCNDTGQEGGRTKSGTFTRSVKQRFWSNDWEATHRYVLETGRVDLLERRLAQTVCKEILAADPQFVMPGVQVDSRYDITVRRAK